MARAREAKTVSDRIAKKLDPETDDVVVLDMSVASEEEQRVYQPLHI